MISKFMTKSAAAILMVLMALPCYGQEKRTVRFMPAWIPQAQFAGYYMALEKGFYDEVNLDVKIVNIPSNSPKTSLDYLADKAVDICCSQFINGMICKDKGYKICCVLQTSQNSGLLCVTHKPIQAITDLNGMKVGRWKSGYGELADLFCMDQGFSDVRWVYFLHGVNLFVSKAVDATLCYSYSEYLDLLFAKGSIPEDHIFRFSKMGYNYPEDGLFVKNSFNRKHRGRVDDFIKATVKGWEYARNHREETIDVVMSYAAAANVKTNRVLQAMMLDEVLRLQENPATGIADFAPIDRDIFNALNDDLLRSGIIKEAIIYEDINR